MAGSRPHVPELFGWAEFLDASGRTDHGLRYMQAYEGFPEPVVELRMGPVYLAAECRAFLAANPRLHGAVNPRMVERIYLLRDQKVPVTEIAEVTGVSVPTIYRKLSQRGTSHNRERSVSRKGRKS